MLNRNLTKCNKKKILSIRREYLRFPLFACVENFHTKNLKKDKQFTLFIFSSKISFFK